MQLLLLLLLGIMGGECTPKTSPNKIGRLVGRHKSCYYSVWGFYSVNHCTCGQLRNCCACGGKEGRERITLKWTATGLTVVKDGARRI